MKKKILLLPIICFCMNVIAQVAPNVEGWRVHLPYFKASSITELSNKMYVGSSSGIISIDLKEFYVERLSKITGLSDVEVKLVKHNKALNITVVVYENANIDIIDHNKNTITNLPDVRQLSIIGSKTINNLCFYNNNVYMATDFGIVLIDLEKKRVIDSYQNIGINGTNLIFYDVAIFRDVIYGATIDGIYSASLNENNLSDFNFWKKNGAYKLATQLEVFRAKLYAVVDSNLKIYDGLVSWDNYSMAMLGKVKNMQVNNNNLSMVTNQEIITEDANGIIKSYSNIKYRNDALVSNTGKLYLADNSYYLQIYPGNTGEYDYIIPNGPTSKYSSSISYGNGTIWAAAGAMDDALQKQFVVNRFFKFKDNVWENYIDKNIPELNGVTDIIEVKVNPISKKVYAASFGNGVIEMDENATNVLKKFDQSNSSLQTNTDPTFKQLYTPSITFDITGNLWVSNHSAPSPISLMKTDGTWKSFSIGSILSGANELLKINSDQDNNLWITLKREVGLLVYNTAGTVDNPNDDQYKILTTEFGNGYLPSNQVLCAVPDKQGEIWIGTSKGLTILSNPSLIFNTTKINYDARQIVIKTGLVNSNFLGSEAINCIKVDGGNRKWIGTRNGVWYVSPDGYSVIKNFTTLNSPILSNNVLEIGIDEKTGEVFFVTDKGMVSYMATSTEPAEKLGGMFIYPNPVRPDYSGLITIRGLVKNTILKITDISGNLVYETTSNGGTAVWDGTTYSGHRAATGVYLIFAAKREGEESQVGKILFIN